MKSSYTQFESFSSKFRQGKLYIRVIESSGEKPLIFLCTKTGNKPEGVVVHYISEVGIYSTNFSGNFIPFVGTITLTEE